MEKSLEEKIIELHLEGKKIREIERIVGCSFSKVMDTVSTIGHEDEMLKTYPIIEGKNLYAVCKKTGKEFIDYKNTSGCINLHIKEQYPNLVIDSNFKRKSLERKTKKYWFHDYFDFIHKDIVDIPKVKCRYCDWETEDVDNLAGSFQLHVLNQHNISGEKHIEQYPDDIKYFKHITKALKTPEHIIKCLECGEMFLHLSTIHLKTHNLTVDQYVKKYNIKKFDLISDTTVQKLKNMHYNNPEQVKFNKSKAENKIFNHIKSHDIKIKGSDRKLLNGMEIDMVMHDYNLAIEYNGLYYHGEIMSGNGFDYHINKQNILNDKGYRLIHIFEDDLYRYENNILNKVSHILKKSSGNKIYARKCVIQNIDIDSKNSFINENRFNNMNDDSADILYGLFYNKILVMIMTFNKINNDEFELVTTLSRSNDIIVGGVTKLFNNFIKNHTPRTITTYADKCWINHTDFNIYNRLGFEQISETKPKFWFFKRTLMKRGKYSEDKLTKNFMNENIKEFDDKNKDLFDEISKFKYDRIWDCGLIKYLYKRKNE